MQSSIQLPHAETCSHPMTASLLTQTLLANNPGLTAATCVQSSLASLSRQLHHAFRPASPQLQRLSRSCLPLRASQATSLPTVLTAAADDTSKSASGNALSVKAAFIEAGLSKAAVDHITTQYPPYLGWDVEQKLLLAMQCWQQELQDRFVCEFERIPYLLYMKPAEELLKVQYLASIGIESPERLRKKSPYVFRQSLDSM